MTPTAILLMQLISHLFVLIVMGEALREHLAPSHPMTAVGVASGVGAGIFATLIALLALFIPALAPAAGAASAIAFATATSSVLAYVGLSLYAWSKRNRKPWVAFCAGLVGVVAVSLGAGFWGQQWWQVAAGWWV